MHRFTTRSLQHVDFPVFMPLCHEIDAAQCRPHADRPFLLARSRPTFLRIVRTASQQYTALRSRSPTARPRILCIRYARPMGGCVRLPRAPEISVLRTTRVCRLLCSLQRSEESIADCRRRYPWTAHKPTIDKHTLYH